MSKASPRVGEGTDPLAPSLTWETVWASDSTWALGKANSVILSP